MTHELFRLRDVSVQYRGMDRPAIDAINLSVHASRHLAIIGESGSGKSTLARVLIGMQRPSEGSVHYRGEAIPLQHNRQSRQFRSRVQMVLQDPFSALSPRMPIGRIIAEPIHALRPDWDASIRVNELLDAVELPRDVAQRLPHQLSGGQRQRVAIARALGPRPETVIADEPVSALDVSVRAQVLALLRQLVADDQLTMIVISHDLGIVQGLCDEVAVMSHGVIREHGPVSHVLNHPQDSYTQTLLASVPRLPDRALEALI